MTDITTVEEVSAEGYTVRVGQTDDGSAWEAVVLTDDSGDDNSVAVGMPQLLMAAAGTDSDDADDTAPVGPPVTAPHRWVAIGLAIEAYEFRESDDHPADADEVYALSAIESMDLELDTDADTTAMFDTVDQTFTGSFSLEGGDDE